MKEILIISYAFGGNTPVGIGIERIVKELASNYDCKFYIITSSTYLKSIPNTTIITCEHVTLIPHFIIYKLSNMLGKELYYKNWENIAFEQIKRLFKHHNISCVYARSTPIASCMLASRVKSVYNTPIIMHFTDPIPAPIGWAPNTLYRKRMISQMRDLFEKADLISLGNKRMIEYQQKILNIDCSNKLFISPDPGPHQFIRLEGKRIDKNKEIKLLFLGNLYGNRNPQCLFDAIEQLRSVYDITLDIYGDNSGDFPSWVTIKDRVSDISTALSQADILIDLDGDDDEPVFISSKLKDYLSVNRLILSITPKHSPSRELLEGLFTVKVVENKITCIKEALINLIENSNIQDFSERNNVVSIFTPKLIASEIMNKIHLLI